MTLADYYVQDKRIGVAEQIYIDGIDVRTRQFGSDHLQVALAELRFGQFLLQQRELQRAEEPLKRAYQHLTATQPTAKAAMMRAAMLLVELYTSLNRDDEVTIWGKKLNDLNTDRQESN